MEKASFKSYPAIQMKNREFVFLVSENQEDEKKKNNRKSQHFSSIILSLLSGYFVKDMRFATHFIHFNENL